MLIQKRVDDGLATSDVSRCEAGGSKDPDNRLGDLNQNFDSGSHIEFGSGPPGSAFSA